MNKNMYLVCTKHNGAQYKVCLIEMFKRIVEVLNSNQIQYWAIFGTCLGAVRESGMIKWDDDIDIGVKRSEYNSLVECIRRNCPDLFVWDWRSDANCTLPYGRVFFRVEEGISIEKYRAYVDIFIIDKACSNRFMRRLESAMLRALIGVIKKKVYKVVYISHLGWSTLVRLFFSPFMLLPISWVHKAYVAVVRIMAGNCYVQCLHEFGQYSSRVIPKYVFEDSRCQKFEGYFVPVPKAAEQYLTIVYGDWKTPPPREKQRGYAWNSKEDWIVAMPIDAVRK